MSGAMSKGAHGERELAAILTAEGFDARRGLQHRGGPDSPDVIVPSLHRSISKQSEPNGCPCSPTRRWRQAADRGASAQRV